MSSVGQVVDASSAAVHLGVLVANGIWFDDYDLGVHFLAVFDLLDCLRVDGEHSVLNAFLQEHFLLDRVAGIFGRVQVEELVGASNRNFQQNGQFLSGKREVNSLSGKFESSLLRKGSACESEQVHSVPKLELLVEFLLGRLEASVNCEHFL